MTCRC